jgi:UDP-N-acetylglucosamine acyltransferase
MGNLKLAEAIAELTRMSAEVPEIAAMADFIGDSSRSIVR